MNCGAYDRWLDEGLPEPLAAAARLHELSCLRCARAKEAARQIESLLERADDVAPAGFSAEVMRRIACGSERTQASWIPLREPSLPIWVRFLATPEAALAAILGGVLAVRGAQIARCAAELSGSLLDPLLPHAESLGRQIASSPALATMALLGLAAGACALYRIGLELTSPKQI